MNPDSSDTPDLPQADGPTTDAGAAAAPKKRVRAKKVVADASPAAAEVTAGEGEAPVAEAAAEPVKAPRKPRAPRKTAAVAEVSASVAMPEHGAESESHAAPAPAVLAQSSDADAFADSSKSVNVDGGDAPAQLSAVESPSSEAPADREDRTRGRRRGRRGGGRGDEAERGDEAPVAVSAAVPVVMPDAAEVFASLVSGEFDVEPEGAAEPLADEVNEKRVLLPDADAPKLHKVLAQSGIGSRRDMEQMILEGRVTVNGEVAHTGMRISFGDRIAIDGKPARVRIAPPPPRLIAYHKPVGEVVTHEDPQQRPTVFRKLPRLSQGKWQSVGRLDINTEGLLLFTTSGDLANKLMHPRFGVEREYAVRVLGTLEKDAKERLLQGVEIEGQSAAFKSIEEGGGEGINRWYRVVIAEGRNREVRKLFDAVGLTVSRLIRVRYGCIVLPRGLKRGVCVDLGEADVKALRQLTGTLPGPRGEGRNDERAERGDQRGQGR
ncbi:pseudouridine synthase, partial [Ideonella sp.]|uniref:pseudouridine synthase n=1 Tax=Ideonella sp. TaxID=1929293 RepID=UPI003BB5F528